jgi:hypothetical protein
VAIFGLCNVNNNSGQRDCFVGPPEAGYSATRKDRYCIIINIVFVDSLISKSKEILMAGKLALLMAKMDPPAQGEAEWNEYYDTVPVADRSKIPGFLSARRFIKIEGIPEQYFIPGESKCLALYDLADINVLREKPYRNIWEKDHAQPAESFEAQIFKLPKFARGVYKQIFPQSSDYKVSNSKFVLLVGHEVPRGKTREFDAWYNTEHIPTLLKVPGVLNIRRFLMAERQEPPMIDRGGIVSKYLTVWDVEEPSGFASETFLRASASPWSKWVRSWYTRKICCLYRQIYPKD